MVIRYSEPVAKCYFTIKSMPKEDFRQREISHDISMTPSAQYSTSNDSFGNEQIIGCVNSPHDEYDYIIRGLVETQNTNIASGVEDRLVGMYKYPHGKCIPGDAIKAFAGEMAEDVNACASVKEKSLMIMSRLNERMTYEPGSTEVETSAEEAFQKQKGVCQDFSHIYICLLRHFGIPARYVCGLIVGEGASHAWVEAVCDGNYLAFDPTHNREVTDEYIKFGVGRDALDCAINRGVMWGGGKQTQEVNVTVEKTYE